MEKFADKETVTSPFQTELFISTAHWNEESKIKRRVEEQNSSDFNTLKEGQEKFLEVFNRNVMQRERLNNILERKVECREAKIMMIDLNTITDPNKREFMNQQQLKIVAKRARQQDQDLKMHLGLLVIFSIISKDPEMVFQTTNGFL
ncbi:hypothetical protein Ddye_009163 [Dipteronia dyeriana]|uniref:Uncharacterized protein n=1 Tax=Dipteronia dyeriana TaxID=168575 RepID=A0AAE0CM19_9ROSI|nr:hypothetical protein Ddye_009163 [Dipteronia dyeriana]